MHDEIEEWLMRPVYRGLCKAESIVDGTLDLEMFAWMNDYLDVVDENEARSRAASKT